MSGTMPALRFPKFGVGWHASTLGEFMTFKNGVNAEKEKYGTGTKFINVLDVIAAGPITHDKIIGSVVVSDKELAKNEVRYGDILFQRSSETREEVGQSNIYLDPDKNATFGGFVIRGRPIRDLDPRFFDSLLKTSNVRSDMTSRSGGSTRYNIGQEALALVPIHLPTLPEQQKIAAFLGAVDGRLAGLRRAEAGLVRFKAGLMQRLFSQKLRFTRDDGSAFPEWEEKRLGEIVQIHTGSSNREDSGETGSYAFFDRSIDIRRSDRFLFDCEAIIVAGEGKSFPPRYFVGKFDLHQRAYAIHSFGRNLGKFIFHWIDWHQNEFLKLAVGSTMPSLRMECFNRFPLKLPHPDEQRKIASALSALNAKIETTRALITKTERFKQGLLQQMFV